MLELPESRLSDCNLERFIPVRNYLERLPEVPTFEDAAQRTVEVIYSAFRSSLVLVRLFITVPYGQLPSATQRVVREAAQAYQIADLLRQETVVLSLAGTVGRQPGWNDRKQSRGHQGIPLISSRFVDSIPMTARLLHEMGMSVKWIDTTSRSLFDQNVGTHLFYVPDAETTVDGVLRKVIPDQNFVRTHGVKTVFGVGGSFVAQQSSLLALVVFCAEPVPKSVAGLFSTLTTQLVAKSYSAVRNGALFRP